MVDIVWILVTGTSARRTRQDRAILGRERAKGLGVEFLELDRVIWQVAFQFHVLHSPLVGLARAVPTCWAGDNRVLRPLCHT